MPLLDIATPQPSLGNQFNLVRSRTFYHVSFIYLGGNTTRLGSSWRYFHIPDKANNIETRHAGGLIIKAVATLEPRCSDRKNDNSQQLRIDSTASLQATENKSSNEDSTELEEREKLRRMRISKANTGNTPWNKGRKHSPETLQLIRERTRLAMQDPKVKMKLAKLGHSQTKETRTKIGAGVRQGWERRREKLMVQETCVFEWLNLIAEASRRGLSGEEELQWDSYEVLDQQLKQEWEESVELRKRTRTKGNKRAPKSLEQRRKISEAIAAKWADPSYRERVYSGICKYHGSTGIPKPRRETNNGEHRKTNPSKKKSKDLDGSAENMTKIKSQGPKLKRSKTPLYIDPQANAKLEMIKSIRAQRAAADTTKNEVITRAKLLIAEAERAADALEIAASKSPIARASLIETRKLISEAIRSIESIGTGDVQSLGIPNESDKDDNTVDECMRQMGRNGVNGVGAFEAINAEIKDFNLSKLDFQDRGDLDSLWHGLLNGKEHIRLSASSNHSALLPLEKNSLESELDKLTSNGGGSEQFVMPLDKVEESSGSNEKQKQETAEMSRSTKTKKWVRGRLVEVDEDE